MGSYECVVGTYDASLVGLLFSPAEGKGRVTFGYTPHAGCVKTVCTSPDGRFLMSGGNDETIKLYNLRKRVELGSLDHHTGSVTCGEFFWGKSTRHLLTGSEDRTICIWRTKDWECMHSMSGHKKGVTGLSVHPSGCAALSTSFDSTVRLWDLMRGCCASVVKTRGGEGSRGVVQWMDAGKSYVLAGDKGMRSISADTGDDIRTIEMESPPLVISPIGSHLCCGGGEDKLVSLWDLRGKTDRVVLHSHNSRIKGVSAVAREDASILDVADSYYVTSGSSDGMISLIDCRKPGEALAEYHTGRRITCMTALPSQMEASVAETGTKQKNTNDDDEYDSSAKEDESEAS
eukprot:Rmarinus@m.984